MKSVLGDRMVVVLSDDKRIDNEKLGRIVREYLFESDHNSWEGFSPRDLTGIRKFNDDLALYIQNYDA